VVVKLLGCERLEPVTFSPEDFMRLAGMWDRALGRSSPDFETALISLFDDTSATQPYAFMCLGSPPESLLRWMHQGLRIEGATGVGAEATHPLFRWGYSDRSKDVDFGLLSTCAPLDLDRCFWYQQFPLKLRSEPKARFQFPPSVLEAFALNEAVVSWPRPARVVSLVPLGTGEEVCGVAEASGARTLFVVHPRQMRFQDGFQWNGDFCDQQVCPFAMALVVWESPAARVSSPWGPLAGPFLLEWARTALADGESGITLSREMLDLDAVVPVDTLLAWHGCPMSADVVRPQFIGPVQHELYGVVEHASSAVVAMRSWPRKKWVWGIIPSVFPAACALLHWQVQSALRKPFLSAWWRMWQRVDYSVRPSVRSRGDALDAQNTRCQRLLVSLGLDADSVWPGQKPDRWTGSANLGALDLCGLP
jgi:hypothetical protein